MCRLALLNKLGEEYIQREMGLLKYLDFLEKQCGGSGNGLVLVKNQNIIFYRKGLRYNNKEIAKVMQSVDYDYAIYHTRVASAGSVSDKNCHPFVNISRNDAMCMNGTERSFADIGKVIDKTDTELVFQMVQAGILPMRALTSLSANYLGVEGGLVYAVSNSSYSPLNVIQEDGAIIIASSFPTNMKYKEFENKLWYEGEPIPIIIRKAYVPPIYVPRPVNSMVWDLEPRGAKPEFNYVSSNSKYENRNGKFLTKGKDGKMSYEYMD